MYFGHSKGRGMNKSLHSILPLFFSTTFLFAQDPHVITITGFAKVGMPAEISEIKVGIESEATTAEEAHLKTSKKSDELVRVLKAYKTIGLQTEGIRIIPVHEYSKSSSARETRGYRALNYVSIRVSINDAGKILDECAKFEANHIFGLRFFPTQENDQKASLQALQEAAQDARQKSDAVLSALGLKAKEIIEVQADAGNPNTLSQQQLRGMTKERVNLPTEGGMIYSEARVTLRISY
ncbi:PF04402 family protein [Leptospira broomii serovar Hurstbridge str. 5399]|uniref:PF04402 family protein n=2 Tax=Leptospira broomii TaxID=301541 RepID=T0F8R0_9LEPT|nr:PF04402 family protein [Leptospira broomii serovar Hurstbridge str. 5399]